MAQFQAARFELCLWSVSGTRRVTAGRIFQQWFPGQHFEDVLGILLPVGCHVDVTSAFEPLREIMNESRLQQAAFVMAFLWPRIWKEHMDAVQAAERDHVAHDFNGVVLDDAHILELKIGNLPEQTADARRVHFNANEVGLRLLRCDLRGGFSHAEADFKNSWRVAAKHGVEIDQVARIRNAVNRQQRLAGEALRAGHAALAENEAANRAMGTGHRARMIAPEPGGTKGDRSQTASRTYRKCATVVCESALAGVLPSRSLMRILNSL